MKSTKWIHFLCQTIIFRRCIRSLLKHFRFRSRTISTPHPGNNVGNHNILILSVRLQNCSSTGNSFLFVWVGEQLGYPPVTQVLSEFFRDNIVNSDISKLIKFLSQLTTRKSTIRWQFLVHIRDDCFDFYTGSSSSILVSKITTPFSNFSINLALSLINFNSWRCFCKQKS